MGVFLIFIFICPLDTAMALGNFLFAFWEQGVPVIYFLEIGP